MIERSTKDILEYLGELGGLLDALLYMFGIALSPVVAIALNRELLTQTFRFIAQPPLKDKQRLDKRMHW